MDLAHTRRVLSLLHRVGRVRNEDLDFNRRAIAQQFLARLQKHGTPYFDGGFYFSTVVAAANKGREEKQGEGAIFRSYATATCDGILALLACEAPREDERIVKAVEWLRAHPDVDYPQGVPADHPEPWGEAIRYYHYSVRAEAYAALAWPGAWRREIAAVVTKSQAADGSFRNTVSPLMKEDDPVLCTALAVVALSNCLE
jgi:hypothetical protein